MVRGLGGLGQGTGITGSGDWEDWIRGWEDLVRGLGKQGQGAGKTGSGGWEDWIRGWEDWVRGLGRLGQAFGRTRATGWGMVRRGKGRGNWEVEVGHSAWVGMHHLCYN